MEEQGLKRTQPAEAEPEGSGESREAVAGATNPYIPPKATTEPAFKYDRRILVIGGGVVLVFALLLFGRSTHRALPPTSLGLKSKQRLGSEAVIASPATASITPILDTDRPLQEGNDASLVDPDQIARTASPGIRRRAAPTMLGEIPPFDNAPMWQAPPYQTGSQASASDSQSATATESGSKHEGDSLGEASLVFVENKPGPAAIPKPREVAANTDLGIGLLPGTKLRARLESAVSTAVPTPAVAVIEYNYEQNGEIVVPSGAKAFGHLEAADSSGYVGMRFDSLILPDGSSFTLEAAATDLELRPLRGRVEGKRTGKNMIVRSFAGVSEIAATLVGRGSLNQPLSETDLLRERVSNNIGQASDQTIANLAAGEHVSITLPADTEIYLVLGKAAKQRTPAEEKQRPARIERPGIEDLKQLIQLQRELNQTEADRLPQE